MYYENIINPFIILLFLLMGLPNYIELMHELERTLESRPYSPELQPAEKLWPLIREAVANRSFDSIEAVKDAIGS